MTSLDGISELHMSGTRAVFRSDGSARLDAETIARAFEENGLKFESLSTSERPRDLVQVRVDSGIT